MKRADGAPNGQGLSGLVDGLDEAMARQLLVAAAEADESVARSVRLAAAEPAAKVVVLKAVVDDAFRTRRYLDWRESSEWAGEAQPAVTMLAEAVAASPSRELIELIERALGHVVKVILRADDSNGSIGGLVADLLELHAVACDSGAADPLRLAKWMIRFEFGEQDFFNLDPVRYATALGERGLAAYRAEIGARYRTDDPPFAAKRAVERLAVLDRDVDRIVELLGGDQSRPHQFIAVANAMLELGLDDDALAWTARGIATTSGWQVAKLYDIACAIHAGRGEWRVVVDLRRQQHQTMPSSVTYTGLRSAAEQTGTWHLEQADARRVLADRDRGEFIDALLDDGDADDAWHAATASPSWDPGERRRLRLAQAREAVAPAEAAGAYLAIVDKVLERADRRAYNEAIRHLKAARRASTAGGIAPFFDAHIARLREVHRRRPTLIALLDKAGLR